MAGKYKLIPLILVFIVAAVAGVFILANWSVNSTIGTDNTGYVTKEVYSHYSNPSAKIAIVTGMHSRENVSKTVVPYSIKAYALTHNVEIVNYRVTVTASPQDFTVGRANGENLVNKYVVPDVDKSNYDLVIVCHDHEKGYGEGFYIATPVMDSESVTLATAVQQLLPSFNYYKRSTSSEPKSSSITKVDAPLVSGGTAMLVYEIPEWIGNQEAFTMSYNLIDACFKVLQ